VGQLDQMDLKKNYQCEPIQDSKQNSNTTYKNKSESLALIWVEFSRFCWVGWFDAHSYL